MICYIKPAILDRVAVISIVNITILVYINQIYQCILIYFPGVTTWKRHVWENIMFKVILCIETCTNIHFHVKGYLMNHALLVISIIENLQLLNNVIINKSKVLLSVIWLG
jgi:hypothetical protein